jgi:phosphoglycolate phosphatase
MPGPTIVFDLDGTLIDTAPDLVATLNVILTREGLSPLAYDLARNLVGGGAKAMIARGLEAGGRPCPPSRLEELFADFIEHYSEHLTERSQPFPGVTEKPDPEILRRTVTKAGGTLEQAIMIGDSIIDIHTARAAGIPVIAVDFGYSERPVTDFGPDRTISSFAQLPMSVAAVAQNI